MTRSSWSKMSSAISKMASARAKRRHRSMDEVSAALVAIVLVMCAVFVPTTFLTGISGEFYRQFAVTIATATIISLIVSLTLSPALAARLLQPKSHVVPASGWARRADAGWAVVQSQFRPAERLVCGFHAARCQCAEENARHLCRSRRRNGGTVLGNARRLRAGAGPGLCARRDPAAAGIVGGGNRPRAQASREKAARCPGHRSGGDVFGVRRGVRHAGVQRRRGLCDLQTIR